MKGYDIRVWPLQKTPHFNRLYIHTLSFFASPFVSFSLYCLHLCRFPFSSSCPLLSSLSYTLVSLLFFPLLSHTHKFFFAQKFMSNLGVENGLSGLGYSKDAIPQLVEGTLPQVRRREGEGERERERKRDFFFRQIYFFSFHQPISQPFA